MTAELLKIILFFVIKINSVNADSAIFSITIDAFHTIVADFFGIEITPVAFTAADAFTVIKNALSMFGHIPEHLPLFGLYNSRERMVKLGRN